MFFAAPARDVEDVVVAGLCTGCGLCASIIGFAISMDINIEGNMRSLVRGEVAVGKNEQIMAVCSGVSVHGPGRHQRVPSIWCGAPCVKYTGPGPASTSSVRRGLQAAS